MAFSPDGRHVAWLDQNDTVRVWDSRLEKEIRLIRLDARLVHSLAYSPDGSRLAVAGAASFESVGKRVAWVGLVDVVTGRIDRSADFPGWCVDVQFSPDGKRFATADDSGVVRIWGRQVRQE